MTTVGQRERISQNRVVKLLQRSLGYRYLGDWQDRGGNSSVEQDILRNHLHRNAKTLDLFVRPGSETEQR
jgi:type I restriction enzyme R subunit